MRRLSAAFLMFTLFVAGCGGASSTGASAARRRSWRASPLEHR